jgi:predicted  nucleic acid-binding Zn-ribbon protein
MVRMKTDYAVEFESFNACIDFLYLMLQNQKALEITRGDFNNIVVSQSGDKEYFTVIIRSISRDNLELLQRLAGAPGVESETKETLKGSKCTINDLLQRVRLIPRTESPGDNGIAVALFRADDRQYRQWHSQLLDMGCGDIRVGFVEPASGNDMLSHLLIIGQVPSSFCPPSEWTGWRSQEGVKTIVFYRLRAGPDCSFFVEWDYEYPLVDLERIYDLEEAHSHMVLIIAGSQAKEPSKKASGSHSKKTSLWICLDKWEVKHIFKYPETPLCLPTGEESSRIYLNSRHPSGDAVLDFYMKRDCRLAVAPVESIENEIAWHQRAIEELVRDHHTACLIRKEKIYLAFVFRQILSAGNGDNDDNSVPPLNPNFRRLLEQPYTHLRHLKYGFYKDPLSTNSERYGLHVVIDTNPGTYSQLLTQLADEVFIQRSDWHEWGLPLFVRYGDEVRPRIEDESLVPFVRKLLWEGPRNHPNNEPVLLRTLPADDANHQHQPWEALYLTEMKTLTDLECFRFLNDRFCSHLLGFRMEIPRHIEHKLKENVVEVSENTTRLQEQVLQAAQEGISNAELHWKSVDGDIQRIEGETIKLSAGVNEIEQAFKKSFEKWSEFFLNILKSNETLTKSGAESYKEYVEEHQKAVNQLGEYEKGLRNVKEDIKKDNVALGKKRADLNDLKGQCSKSEAELQALMRTVEAEEKVVMEKMKEVNNKIDEKEREVNKRLEGARKQVDELKIKIDEHKKQQQLLREEQNQLINRQEELNTLKDSNDKLQNENVQTKERLDTKEKEIKKIKAELDRAREKLDKKQEELRLEPPYEKILKNLRQEIDNLNNEANKFKREEEELKGEKEKLKQKVGEYEAKLEKLKRGINVQIAELSKQKENLQKQTQKYREQSRLLEEKSSAKKSKLNRYLERLKFWR